MKGKRLLARLEQQLEELRRRAQWRKLADVPGVNLCSNDYLGLAEDPRLKEAAARAVMAALRTGSTGSRLLSGNAPEWEELEREFAEFAGTEAALYFGSGYAGNVGLLSSILGRGDMVFSDAANHASLIDGIRLSGAEKVVYPHGDLTALRAALERHADSSGARVIVSETTFSMDGSKPVIGEFAEVARRFDAEIVLDEAHSTGVCGPEGRGRAAEGGFERDVFAVVHMCGKALGSVGAFVCGSRTLKDFLINRARTFIFTTANPPYIAGQIHAAMEMARRADDRRAYLREIGIEMRERLDAAGFETREGDSPIVPVILGENATAVFHAEFLQKRGFAVKAIRPPTVPEGSARLRLSLTAKITREHVRQVVAALEEAREAVRAGVARAAHG